MAAETAAGTSQPPPPGRVPVCPLGDEACAEARQLPASSSCHDTSGSIEPHTCATGLDAASVQEDP
jgi:hypothetical protein